MKNKSLCLLAISLLLVACNNANNVSKESKEEKHEHTFGDIYVIEEADWKTFIKGKDFDPTGLKVAHKCSTCNAVEEVDYSLDNDTELELEQTSVTIKYGDKSIDYPIIVKEKYHLACVGDSLTAGHYWANESYPTMLSNLINSSYQIENCGVNGISITGYGGSWKDPSMKYIKQDVYQKSVDFAPDIFAIMLGTNDGTEWEKAEPTFEEDYRELLDSYVELFPNAKFIMMVSPPCISPNQFDISNDNIKNYVNPIQRELADDYGFEVLDLREEFEAEDDFENRFLRPNDGVHFTKEAAEFVAERVWDIAKNLKL